MDTYPSIRPSSKIGKDLQIIDINSIRNKDVREIGAEWLSYQAMNQLQIVPFLECLGCLYHISKKLYAEKDALEQHLSVRTNELFDIEDRIMLYDLTNTYFEGIKQGSKLAQYGRSKEKRSDAELVVLALVVNPEGFIK